MELPEQEYDAVIIGGGPAGATTTGSRAWAAR